MPTLRAGRCCDTEGLNQYQPMLEAIPSAGQKNKVHLVPELCLQTNIPPKIKEALPTICSKKPHVRRPAMLNFRQMFQGEESAKILKDHGIVIGNDCVSVGSQARELPPPVILLAGRHQRRGEESWEKTSLAREVSATACKRLV